eukprot:CAMPEP_0177328294 /NCGR_PEP_ID=MMETSP0368-20130122/19352_1 /TAXON_ID=447022 ORGANISM="Scrippsiella hangoei-like, Strain SHHI-4" /NCGR_SAMPLE_ID=MMETSP0368 /ASSEMBLY_ACC=CAM_ASM_000363 /LENGTH=49 /DNA_ID= /DNA_START= /DNA_END= /DNA_ORIENTATION=
MTMATFRPMRRNHALIPAVALLASVAGIALKCGFAMPGPPRTRGNLPKG